MTRYSGAVWQDGIQVAYASGENPTAVEREIFHYAGIYRHQTIRVQSRSPAPFMLLNRRIT